MIAIAIGYAIFAVRDFGEMLFGPNAYSDEKVRTYITEFGIHITSSASHLYYCRSGFDESFVYIGMTVEPHDAWVLIRSYIDKSKQDFQPLQDHPELEDPGSKYGEEFDTDLWNLAVLQSPLYYEERDEISRQVVIYDEGSKRLLVYYWIRASF